MTLSAEKTIIISGSIIGSVVLFSTSLSCLNELFIRGDEFSNHNKNDLNKLFVINGITMLFSGSLFGYFTYIAIK